MNYLTRRLSIFCKKQTFNRLISGKYNAKGHYETLKGCKQIHNGRSSTALLACLESRGLVRLHGKDSADFLQGLVTSDVHELMSKKSSAQYSFMLNVKGRILYDLFLYNMDESTIFVDVPAPAIEEFMGLLKRYRLRRKVDISNITDEFKVWSQFLAQVEGNPGLNSDTSPANTVISCPDPRIADFGRRLIIRRTPKENSADCVDENVYIESRYRWGLCEGFNDLPPGNCFPLESNGEFLNAVSFDKGCYVGQELTARTYHTGVTRKRLMPLVFTRTPPEIEKDATIQNEKGRSAGKVRGCQGSYGLGLVRLAQTKENLFVTACDKSQVSLQTHIPHWWPEFDSN